MCLRGNSTQAFPFLRKSEETHGGDSRDAIVRVIGEVLALLIKVVTPASIGKGRSDCSLLPFGA